MLRKITLILLLSFPATVLHATEPNHRNDSPSDLTDVPTHAKSEKACQTLLPRLNQNEFPYDPERHFQLGLMNQPGIMAKSGQDMPADSFVARNCLEEAARNNDMSALYQLALMQYSVSSSKQHKSTVIEQFARLASAGFAPAQYMMGYLNLKGDDIPQNLPEAKNWFEKAAAQNDVRATASLAWLYLKGVGTAKDESKAALLFETAAQMNDAYSLDQLGLMAGKGRGMPPDARKAFNCFEKAALQDYPPAQRHLALMYFGGIGTEKNPEKGTGWLLKASALNDTEAQHLYASMLFLGRDIQQDLPRAIDYFTRAANNGHAESQYILGTIYVN